MAQRVLVAEDDLLNRMLFCAWLEGDRFEVEAVEDGRNVMAKAREFHPDLIVMDIQLPNVSGVELIEHLRADARLRDIPVLAVTGYVGIGEERRVRRAGAKEYLPKPVRKAAFVEAVESLLSEDPKAQGRPSQGGSMSSGS